MGTGLAENPKLVSGFIDLFLEGKLDPSTRVDSNVIILVESEEVFRSFDGYLY